MVPEEFNRALLQRACRITETGLFAIDLSFPRQKVRNMNSEQTSRVKDKERVKNKLSFWVSNEVVPFWAFRIKSNELLDLVFEVLFDRSFGFIGFQVDFGDHLQPCFCGCGIG